MNKRPTYKDLLNIIDELRGEIKELKERLLVYENPKNSNNSHIAPSKDENRPLRNQSLREKSNKKVGGQIGHEGKTLQMIDTPDEIINEIPKFCNCCGKDLSEIKEEFAEKRQVFDIPEIRMTCKEYHSYKKKCSCGYITISSFPSTISSPVQYGTNTEAMISYLYARQYMSFNRIEECMNDVFGIPISEGGIHNLLQRFTEKARNTYQRIKTQIELSSYVGSDETGAKVNGKKHWFWTWQNEKLTYIVHSVNRGIDTINRVFANGLPNAVLQHDRWKSHFHCKSKGHQLCIVHLLRDINYIIELYDCNWAKRMKELLKKSIDLKKKLKPFQYDFRERDKLEKELNELLYYQIDLSYKKAIVFQKSLLKYHKSILLFLYHQNVPPDNNGSERSIRNVKVKQKISGQFKSEKGAEIYAINRSVIDTIIKSKQNVLGGLQLIANYTSD